MKNLVVLTGAGMSAESGISTFRDAGGLWDRYPVEQVATPEGYQRDPALVINFYNERRKQLLEVKPNRGHELLAELEKSFHVTVVTQNIDNLHERALRGSVPWCPRRRRRSAGHDTPREPSPAAADRSRCAPRPGSSY